MTALMPWLVPAAGRDRDWFAATIDRLAAEHGAPRFQPHVTVAVTFDAVEDAAAQALALLVAEVPPVDLTFDAIGHEATYFRALYLRAMPARQLLALQQAAQRTWALAPFVHVPHLSLLYSDLAEEHKRPIIDSLDISLPLTIRFDAVELWARDPRGVRSWYRTGRIPLSGVPAP
jgi:2'-5' RNA ligase